MRQAIVLLQVDRQVGVRPLADFGQGLGIFVVVDRDPHDVGPGRDQIVDLRDRRLDVLRVRGRHALHGDRVRRADRNRADANRASWIAAKLQGI